MQTADRQTREECEGEECWLIMRSQRILSAIVGVSQVSEVFTTLPPSPPPPP